MNRRVKDLVQQAVQIELAEMLGKWKPVWEVIGIPVVEQVEHALNEAIYEVIKIQTGARD